MTKRLLSTLLALCMALALLPGTALAAAETMDDIVGIYLSNKSVWLAAPDNFFDDNGYYYGLLDFEGDGVPELFFSECLGTGTYSTNIFYKVDINARSISRIQNIPEDLKNLNLGDSGVRIYQDGQTGQLLYYSEKAFNMGLSDWVSQNAFFYMQNGALSMRWLWGQRTADWNTEYYYCTDSGEERAVSESEWIRHQEEYLNRYTLLADSVPTTGAVQMGRANDESLRNTLRGLCDKLYQSVGATPAGPEQPAAPSTPAAPAKDVVLSPQKLAVDGRNVDCEKYNIGGSNYFKLRDLAYLLNGTGSQFGVGFDEAASTVSITTKTAYMPAGTELVIGVDNSVTAQPSAQSILIDGAAHNELTVYNIGGSNFFQLRELGGLLGFEVDFDVDTNTAIVRSA